MTTDMNTKEPVKAAYAATLRDVDVCAWFQQAEWSASRWSRLSWLARCWKSLAAIRSARRCGIVMAT